MPEKVTTELEAVIHEREGPIARLILNQPEKANTQSSAMVHDMEACLHDVERDYDVRVLILKARGNGFCAGHVIGRQGTAYEEFKEAQERVGSSVRIPPRQWAASRLAGEEAAGGPGEGAQSQ